MFDWSYIDADGETTGASEKFDTQEAAEAWVGETYEQLAKDGIAEMILRDLDGDKEIYRMGMGAA